MLEGVIASAQVEPNCVMLNCLPPTEMFPVRDAGAPLAVTVYCTVPGPVPEAVAVATVTKSPAVVAFQLQREPVETAKLPWPPIPGMVPPVGIRVYVQGGGSSTVSTTGM